MTQMNRASGAFRDGSNRANSGGSNLCEILLDFKDFGVLGNQEIMLVDKFQDGQSNILILKQRLLIQ